MSVIIADSLRRQRTLKKIIEINGQGLFSAVPVCLRLLPAPVNHGIVFCRKDLTGQPLVPVNVANVIETPNCTSLGLKDAQVQTVEHFLSVLHVLGIDNLLVEINGPELPIGDGSASIFAQALEKAPFEEQRGLQPALTFSQPFAFSSGHIHLVALPDSDFKISYTLAYPESKLLSAQYYTFTVTKENYFKEIASSRTFARYEDIKVLLANGFLRGGGLQNAVLIKDEKILNPEGLRYQNEMVRHKILDLIGDLALLGKDLHAHIIAIRSGHLSNVLFAKKISRCKKSIASW